ncbi:MAG: hypothetical protein ACAI35_09400 [Candidatus Methylacidiphilales bacterium]|nr:hypothetical protein [Candidatus Methylacidiphilales bacterium]
MTKNRALLRILEILEDNPLNADAWKCVLALCKNNRDEFRANAIDILLEGFHGIRKEERCFVLQNIHITSILLRLSFAKKIEPLLKEIALFFLNELNDPYTTQGICHQVIEHRISDEDFCAMLRESESLIKQRKGIFSAQHRSHQYR